MLKLDKQEGSVRTLIIIAGVLIIIAATITVVFMLKDRSDLPETTGTQTDTTETEAQPQPEEEQPEITESGVISYGAGGYTPSTITVELGETVTFRNDSTSNMWPASDNHPTHEIYPEFDPGRAIEPGQEWQFTFDQAGAWGYHDHLNPAVTGTIIVE